MKILKRIVFFISLFLVYIIIKEFLALYTYTKSLHPYAGYATLIIIAAFLIYFAAIPLFRLIVLPQYYSPTRDPEKISTFIQIRLKRFQKNTYLIQSNFDFDALTINKDGYEKVTAFLKPEIEKIRKKYVTQVFYGTAIAQNGFLDAVIILSSSINMIKEMFMLYRGRVSNRELFRIARMVYYSIVIGGSEGVEYAVDEIVSKVFSGGIKGIPFASKILGSIADGFINAALLTRISIITENYCQFIFIESERALYPSYKTVVSATRIITSDLIERILREVKRLAKDKTHDVISAVNPVRYIFEKAMGRHSDDDIPYYSDDMQMQTKIKNRNPLRFIGKWIHREKAYPPV
jgi:hypothetical protein